MKPSIQTRNRIGYAVLGAIALAICAFWVFLLPWYVTLSVIAVFAFVTFMGWCFPGGGGDWM